MPRDDWLVGGDRRTIAAERIYDAATDLIAREGVDALDIDRLAALVHCSRATVYRYAGGKAEIRDAVLTRAAADVIDASVRPSRTSPVPERVVTAITLALKRIRSDPLSQLMIGSVRGVDAMSWLTASPLLAAFATDLAGLTVRPTGRRNGWFAWCCRWCTGRPRTSAPNVSWCDDSSHQHSPRGADASLLVAEGFVEFGQETREVIHLLRAVHQQIASGGSESPSTRDAMGRTALDATPGALRTAMCGPPIQNRERISDPLLRRPDVVDEPSDVHRGVAGAQPRTDRHRIVAVGRAAHLRRCDELDCAVEHASSRCTR